MPKGAKISFWLEKSLCCTCSRGRKWTVSKNLQIYFFTSNLQQNFWACHLQWAFHLFSPFHYHLFSDNNLISPNQPGFRSSDCCVNQLIAITHEIYVVWWPTWNEGIFIRYISKAFDKVWHGGFLLKLSLNGIFENLLNLLKFLRHFLYFLKQRVVLNGQNSSWENVNAWVPQGSI